MGKKFVGYLVLSVLLVAVMAVLAAAQVISPLPDAGVKGSGYIALSNTQNLGSFNITASRWNTSNGPVFSGSIQYAEVSATGARSNVISANVIKSVNVQGNVAVVQAVGMWNNMQADITVTAVDNRPLSDLTSMPDAFRIVAKPSGPITIAILYDRQGPVIKGNIDVFSKPVLSLVATGTGAIKVGMDIGNFNFDTKSVGGRVTGTLRYTELRPFPSTIGARTVADIVIPAVTSLTLSGNVASFTGIGTVNGVKSKITVLVEDNYNPKLMAPFVKPDRFSIHTAPLLGIGGYDASGPLVTGDIVVTTVQ